nr:PA2817 family protein [Pseudomonas sp. TH41]
MRTYLVSNIVADHLVLLDHLRSILVAVGEADQVPEESHALFLERFDELRALLPVDPIESQYLGQDILCQVITRYPQIAHLVPRDLLWYFAGDCLHYMPDDEIALYQALEERRFEAEQNDEPFDWNQEKQLLAMSNDDSKH